MKNEVNLSQLREAAWRRKLTEAEQAALRTCLEADPEARRSWETDGALNAALAALPPAPMPSNFTARVLAAVEREPVAAPARRWNWHVLLPRVAFASVVLAFAGLAIHHHEIYSERAALVKNVALVAGNQPLPSAEALENFDAIRRLSSPPHADDELLDLMQ